MTVRVVTFDDNVASQVIPTTTLPIVTEVQFENNGVRVGDQNTTKINFNDNLTAALDPADATTIIINGQAGGGGGGGHVIEDAAGTDLAQRANLQFTGATVTDDAANDRTIVSPTIGTFFSNTEADEITTVGFTTLTFDDTKFQRVDSDYTIDTAKQRVTLNTIGDYEFLLTIIVGSTSGANIILQVEVLEFDNSTDTTGTQIDRIQGLFVPVPGFTPSTAGGTETSSFLINLTAGKQISLRLGQATAQTANTSSLNARLTIRRIP